MNMGYGLTNDERKHLERIKSMGCVVCRNLGFIDTRNPPPCDAHHLTDGGRRISHFHTIGLCERHHRAGQCSDPRFVSLHPWKARFEELYGTQEKLLEQTRRELAQEGR